MSVVGCTTRWSHRSTAVTENQEITLQASPLITGAFFYVKG